MNTNYNVQQVCFLLFIFVDFILQYYNPILYIYMTQKKKKINKDQQDQSTLKLWGTYRRKCEQNGLIVHKLFKDKIDNAVEQGKLENLQMWEQIGPVNVRAIMDTFTQLNYKHLKKIRLWKVHAQDEGVRSICNFIDKVQSVQYLDLLDNQITPLGCQFLGKALNSDRVMIQKLKLDHNCFGSEGLKNLAIGLSKNSSLEKLSLKYCKIDQTGVKYIQEILANINSKLISLKLQGNPLKNEGVYEVLRAIEMNQVVQKLSLADVQMSLLSEEENSFEVRTRQKLLDVLEKNQTVFKYDIRFNQISDDSAYKIVMKIKDNLSIKKIEISDTVSFQVKELLNEIMKKRKGKKKGKKGSKKSKKKK